MRRKLISSAILLFWVTMMSALVRQQILARTVRPPAGSYSQILSALEETHEDRRMGIYLGGKRIGQSDTHFRSHLDGSYAIDNTTQLKLPSLPPFTLESCRAELRAKAYVNADYRLDWFELVFLTPVYEARVRGNWVGNELQIRLTAGPETHSYSMPLDEDVLLTNTFTPFLGVQDLSLGETWAMKMFNPLTGQFRDVVVRVARKEILQWEGRDVETYVVTVTQGPFQCSAWIREDGEVLKQTALLGLTLIKEIPTEDEDPE